MKINIETAPPITCYKCGKTGHISRNCRVQRNNARLASLDKETNYDADHSSSHNRLPSNEIETDFNHSVYEGHGSVQTTDDCYFLSNVDQRKVAHATSQKQIKSRKPPMKYSEEIINMAKEIEAGKKTYKTALLYNLKDVSGKANAASTVITKTNRERARNKPIVQGMINDKPAKLFLDSGADTNLIDRKFMNNTLNAKIVDSTPSTIRCANGSVMQCVGTVSASVSIGNSVRTVKFRVIDNLFPTVILGIVALKQLRVSLCPWKSCALVDTCAIPFLSKVSEHPKNAIGLCLRTGIKLQ